MSNAQLLQASFADGLRMPNFVNGRLLAAEDLKADQDATLARLGWLGKAAGYGVVEGLMVTKAGATSVSVSPGIGLNRDGQLIRLPGGLMLDLAPATGPVTQPVGQFGRFQSCTFQPAGGSTAVADGAYLLAVLPASRLEGQAPLKASAGSTLPAGCAGKWEVDGLQFKVIRLTGFDSAGSTAQNRQNLLAHWAFGSAALRRLGRNPFTFDELYGGLDQMPVTDLTSCDLPLAVFYWQNGTVLFADAWAARRRLVRPGALIAWTGMLSDKREAEAQARFLQFQAQIDVLLQGSAQGVRATDHFRYLPPAGFLQVRPHQTWATIIAQQTLDRLIQDASAVTIPLPFFFGVALPSLNLGTIVMSGSQGLVAETVAALPATGFDLDTFFDDLPPIDVGLAGRETIDFTLQHSWYDEAIDLQRGPRFRLYMVADQWLRVIEHEMGRLMAERLNGLPGLSSQLRGLIVQAWLNVVRTDLAARLQDDVASAASGAEDPQQLYVLFVKDNPPVQWLSNQF